MKYSIKYIAIIILIFILLGTNLKNLNETFVNFYENENKFKVVVTTYNPGIYFLQKCLDSISRQRYRNFEVCVIDDASTKETFDILNLLQEYNNKYGWKYKQREINIGPCGTRIEAIDILNPEDDDIIVLIDGDDELYDNYVFSKLNYIYNTDKPLITFGNYVRKTTTGALAKYKSLNCRRIDLPNKIENKSFRDYQFHYSHLKTFKYKLYKNIDHKDLMKDGEYIRSATDAAIMIPMLEMAGDKIKCIDDVLYKYTSDHEESIHYKRSGKNQQKENYKYIQGLERYDRL
tara:strand:- start:506 stop:1375 length:870 start_codon:yes stop_codon:yes gene_type:complete